MSLPADELREAAARIRAVAAAATPGPWIDLDKGDRIIRDAEPPMRSYFVDGVRVTEEAAPEYVVDEPLHANPANGAHIALWHPGVAELVAEVLELAAVRVAQVAVISTVSEGFKNGPWPVESAALALARAINASKES